MILQKKELIVPDAVNLMYGTNLALQNVSIVQQRLITADNG